MDVAIRSEDEQYRKSLEALVKARTEQLQHALRENEQLLEVLKQIQSMDSLKGVREAVQTAIKKFAREEVPLLTFGGKAGEPVPAVDPEDLKAVWQMGQELQARHPAGNVATSVDVMSGLCKPGANLEATWYRSTIIWFLSQVAKQQIAPWVTDGQVSDPVFHVMASIPMEWMGSDVRHDLPFDVDDFLLRLNKK